MITVFYTVRYDTGNLLQSLAIYFRGEFLFKGVYEQMQILPTCLKSENEMLNAISRNFQELKVHIKRLDTKQCMIHA